MYTDSDSTPWVESLKSKVTITRGFEKEVPLYVCSFLEQNVGCIQDAVLTGNQDVLNELLGKFTQSIPKETVSDSFQELFLGLFFLGEDKKPHLSIVNGNRIKVEGAKVQSVDLDFPEAPIETKGLLLIHTHPSDSLIGLSEADEQAFSGTFSQRLRLFPQLRDAYIGLCTAKHPDKVQIYQAQEWANTKYFSFSK